MLSSAEGNGNSKAQSAGITSNDFLTLLVAEMKNQDPTAQTDPNEYINQLVQVNSLEQLIEINQNLSSALGTSGTEASPSASPKFAHTIGTMTWTPDVSIPTSRSSDGGGRNADVVSRNAVETIQGNLGTTVSANAAQRVAQALSGRT